MEFLDQLQGTLSQLGVDRHIDKFKNQIYNYTENELKVRDATNLDPWGPTSTQMSDVAQLTYHHNDFQEIMQTLWKRMREKNWRHVYKSLLVLDYLIKNGSDRVIENAREHVYEVRSLESFRFVDENNKDQGINVRQKAKDVRALLQDDERIREERQKAKRNKGKFTGVSAAEMRSGGGGGGGSSSRYGGFENFGRSSNYDAGSSDSSRYGGFDKYGGSDYKSGGSGRYDDRPRGREGGSRYEDDLGDDRYGDDTRGSRRGPRSPSPSNRKTSPPRDRNTRATRYDDASPPRSRRGERDNETSPPRSRRNDRGREGRTEKARGQGQGQGQGQSKAKPDDLLDGFGAMTVSAAEPDEFGDFASFQSGVGGDAQDAGFGEFSDFHGAAGTTTQAGAGAGAGAGALAGITLSTGMGGGMGAMPNYGAASMGAMGMGMGGHQMMGSAAQMGMGGMQPMGMGAPAMGAMQPMGSMAGQPMGGMQPMGGIGMAGIGGQPMGMMQPMGMQPMGGMGMAGIGGQPMGMQPMGGMGMAGTAKRAPAQAQASKGLVNLDALSLGPTNQQTHGMTLGSMQQPTQSGGTRSNTSGQGFSLL